MSSGPGLAALPEPISSAEQGGHSDFLRAAGRVKRGAHEGLELCLEYKLWTSVLLYYAFSVGKISDGPSSCSGFLGCPQEQLLRAASQMPLLSGSL